MPALAPPYVYASITDVKDASCMTPANVDTVLSKLPVGAMDRLLLKYSRHVDIYIGKRREVPLKFTPHASVTMIVAEFVALKLLAKFGVPPESSLSELQKAAQEDLQKLVRDMVSPDGFVDVPESNTEDGTSFRKAQTLCTTNYGPYGALRKRF
jgi:hypothetical protein